MRYAGRLISVIVASILAAACSENQFSELDRLLEQKDEIDAAVRHRTDSLRKLFDAATPQDRALRWQRAEDLYNEWRHLNLDSCAHYTRLMLQYAGEDPSRILRSRAALVRTLVRSDELIKADSVFKSMVLAPDAPQEDCDAYYYSADRLTNYLPAQYRQAFGPDVAGLSRDYLSKDSSNIKAKLFKIKALRSERRFAEALAYAKTLKVEEMNDIYDVSTYYYVMGTLAGQLGNDEEALDYAYKASCVDLSSGMKDYASLYTLAQLLFHQRRYTFLAGRYMNRAVQDAAEYNFPIGITRSARALSIMNEVIQDMNRKHKQLLIAAVVLVSFFLAVALILLFYNLKMLQRVRRANRLYRASQHNLQEVSMIKDKMLGEYMSLASEYIYKVDESRSRYRKILKEKGTDALMTIFREPAFADAEFPHYWNNFDKIFLSIFPDFVTRVNQFMKEGQAFVPESPGSLTTQLRILALIRLGIQESGRISVILHISKGSVYTYRSIMRQASLDPDNFEENVRKIDTL